MLNKIVIMGRLVRDPELRHTQSGTAVTSFTLAVDRDYSGRDGGEKETDFIDCVAWRNTAEFVSKYFTKGRMAVVLGRLQIRPWTDKDGNKRTSAEVVAENVYFGDSKRESDTSDPYRGTSQQGRFTRASAPVDVSADPLDRLSSGYPGVVTSGGFEELTDDDGDLPF